MKSTFTNLLTFKPILICLIMVGLYVVSSPTLHAQSSLVNEGFTSVPNGPYVSSSTAITRLEDQSATLKVQLEIYNTSSLEYKVALARYNFFAAILAPLYEGKSVKESLVIGLGFLMTDAAGDLSREKKQEFKEEAIELLTI